MFKKTYTVLGINPGATYIGIAVMHGSELREWRVKAVKGAWSEEKMGKGMAVISECIRRYEPDAVALKQLHSSRSSGQLDAFVAAIGAYCKRKRIRLCRYSIKELEAYFSIDGNIGNKRTLAEMIAADYPVLFHELYREKSRKNPYHIRMFEAVALAARGFHQLDMQSFV